MSNALLLRLFTSEFFNSWIAVSYLFRYPDNVGIQHYLCAELKKFPISEIEFFLPQLMHLLISRPTESVALECFLVEMCEKSTHMAILSLWYLQAYLSDLSVSPSSPSFELCKRVLNKCQAIVFSEDGVDHSNEIVDATASLSLGMSTHRVRENVMPAVVGIGAILAGIGQPLMTRPAGDIAIAQGRRNRVLSITAGNAPMLARRNTLSGASPSNPSRSPSQASPTTSSDIPSSPIAHMRQHESSSFHSVSQPDLPISKRRSAYLNPFTSSPSLEDLHRGKAFSVSRYIKSAHQKLNRKIRPTSSPSSSRSSRTMSVFDPKMTAMGQSTVPTNSAPMSPALSQFSDESAEDMHAKKKSTSPPRISTASLHDDAHSEGSDEEYSTLSQLSRDHRRSLLRSNYFRSEMQFLLALVDIATRLVIVPKQARTSALNAELTLLNHNLPAEICIPMWCPATAEKPHHHRVVRISPSDAVVLNSAERAPYLLMIEVLDDELSFDDDGYSSALYRMRRLMKQKSVKKNRASLVGSPKSVSSPLSTSQPEEDIAECGSSIHSPDVDSPSPVTVATNGLGISNVETAEQLEPEDQIESERRNSRSAGEYAERMRTAAIMLAQLQQNVHTATPSPGGSNRAASAKNTEQIRQRIIKEMMALEEQRMAKMKNGGVGSGVESHTPEDPGGNEIIEDEQLVAWVVNKEDPSAAVFAEDWDLKKARIRASSPYGHLPNWRLLSVIVKHGSDLRQEQFAVQLIREMQRIWEDTGVDVWVKYFRVLVTSDSSGLIETIRNTISIHSIKKDAYTRGWNTKGTIFTLSDYYERHFGPPTSDKFIKAQDAFMRSLAGYSIACYILQMKDRHNGNILIDNDGHLIHIDFGFLLSNSPGSVGFEMAPFKLPQEYIDILGGIHGEKFAEYKALMKAGFLAVRKHCENIILLVEMMCKDSKLPCFQNGEQTVQQLRERFQLQLTEPQAEEFVDKMIMSSCCNVFTRLYDTYQYYSQGIL
ncbi:kinase-like domain-containing protein [Fennellomyces sp. T-0311]|nr:kinase-like domain-containing protein [Fennellomyces sp. T-0311]